MELYLLYHHFHITDSSSVAGNDGKHTNSVEFDQNSPTTSKEDATKYRQASTSNPEPLALAGAQVTPSTSLELGLAPSSDQIELMIRSESISESNSSTANKPQQQPNLLEAEKDVLHRAR